MQIMNTVEFDGQMEGWEVRGRVGMSLFVIRLGDFVDLEKGDDGS